MTAAMPMPVPANAPATMMTADTGERRYRWMRAGLFFALVCWAMFAGKDVSWDVINHQLYLPFAWFGGRIDADLFGAGPQSYQNPIGYAPIYALVALGLPAWVIGVLLAAVHALVIWPLDRIARTCWEGQGMTDFWFRLMAIVFGVIAPVNLIHAGTTSIDPFTSLMVIWAVTLSLDPETRTTPRTAATAGALLGLASALKLSNAIFAVALCALWSLKWLLGQSDRRRVAAFALALASVFVLAAGPWMWWLFGQFGNPIFPLYNNVFHSPCAPQQAITALRFVPETPFGMVARLWELAKLSSFVSYEAFLPDLRPVVAAVAALGVAVVLLLRGGWRRIAVRSSWSAPGVMLAVVMLLFYVLWIRSSGNARYGLPLFVLAGVALVVAVRCLLPASSAKVLLLTLLVLQGGYYASEGEYRFTGQPWDGGPYLDYRVPRRLQEQPFLHLAIGTQTNASVALFLDRRGALVNPIGQMALPTTGPLGERLESMLAQWRGRTRLLFNEPAAKKPPDVARVHNGLQALLYRLGLDVDWNDCEIIEMVLSRAELRPVQTPAGIEMHSPRRMLSCGVVYRPERDAAVEAARSTAERVFAIMEAACPRVFSPSPLASEHGPGVWQRHYMNTEAQLTVADDGVYFSHFRQIQGARFGSVEDVLAQRVPIQCPRLDYQTPM